MHSTPLEVWLGPIGPLRQRIFQATPPGPLTSIGMNGLPSPLGNGGGGGSGGSGIPGMQSNQGIPALNGLPPPLANSMAALNGMNVAMGGMLNMGMGYGQPQQHPGDGNGGGGGSEGSNGAGTGHQAPSSSSPQQSTAGVISNSNPSPTSATTSPTTGSVPPPTMPPPHSPPVAPPRFIPQGPLHTIILVDLPPISQIVRSARESLGLPAHAGYMGESIPGVPGLEMGINLGINPGSNGEVVGVEKSEHEHEQGVVPPVPAPAPIPPPPPPLPNLPILFIRTYDGMGYHSGRSIACEPNLGPEEIERIRRGVSPSSPSAATAGGTAGTSGSGSGSVSGTTTGNGSGASGLNLSNRNGVAAKEEGPSGGGSGGPLEGDIDWIVRVL